MGHTPMPFSQATPGMPGADAARKSQHTRQLGVNLFSDVKKIRLRDRNLTSEKFLRAIALIPPRRAGLPHAPRLHKLNAIGSYASAARSAVTFAVVYPALLCTPQSCFRHCGSYASNGAVFDPRSRQADANQGVLFYFVVVESMPLLSCSRFGPRSRRPGLINELTPCASTDSTAKRHFAAGGDSSSKRSNHIDRP